MNNPRERKTGKIKDLTSQIQKLLTIDIRYRDDDNLLINRVQKDEVASMGLDPKNVSLYDFFRFRLNNQVTDEDTITRLRRKVQELHADTRGDNYKKRQSKQLDVRGDMREVAAQHSTPPSLEPVLIDPLKCMDCDGSGVGNHTGLTCDSCGGSGSLES